VKFGEAEVYGVALEERARLHRNSGRVGEAVADYLAAALQYDCAQDRVRVMHAVADLMLARGDLEAARESMYVAFDGAMPAQRGHIVSRLRAVARDQGDEVGLRRWPPAKPSALVSLIGPKRGEPAHVSYAALLRRWRDACTAAPVVAAPA
jgi:hypothetical protein